MGWLRRTTSRVKKGRSYASESRAVDDAVTMHLTQFAQSRRGVEAFVEPQTSVTQTTLLLVAFDGEWTRRALPSRPLAFEVARSLDIPVYDVNLTGYPARMREWTSRQRRPKQR